MTPTGPPPGQLRLGVVGLGRISQVAHLPAAIKADRVRLAAVCDASPSLVGQVARHYEVPGFTDMRQLLDEDLDAVLVATPDRSHAALATLALQAGKHVLVEKPLADGVVAAQELANFAASTGLKLQVGAMKRHDPGIEFAKASLPRIGAVVTAQAWYRVMAALRPPTEATLFPRTFVDDAVREVEATYKADRERYLLSTHGAHVFDGIRHLVGEVATLRAEVAHVGKDFSWHGTGRLAGQGGLASFEISANVHAKWAEGFDVYGELGHVSVRSSFPFFRRASEVELFIEGDATTTSTSFGDTDPYERQLEAFARAVLDGGPASPDGADGVAAVRFIEAVRASASRGGEEVHI
ncbi:MAG: Gfo/Idh/MocA family oxidoreductase [Acidimicrobiales bacterium]|jgi:predicted dehydrogenase